MNSALYFQKIEQNYAWSDLLDQKDSKARYNVIPLGYNVSSSMRRIRNIRPIDFNRYHFIALEIGIVSNLALMGQLYVLRV